MTNEYMGKNALNLPTKFPNPIPFSPMVRGAGKGQEPPGGVQPLFQGFLN